MVEILQMMDLINLVVIFLNLFQIFNSFCLYFIILQMQPIIPHQQLFFQFKDSHQNQHPCSNDSQIPTQTLNINNTQQTQSSHTTINLHSLNYSLKQQSSLHSYFSSQRLDDIQTNKNYMQKNQSISPSRKNSSFIKSTSPQSQSKQIHQFSNQKISNKSNQNQNHLDNSIHTNIFQQGNIDGINENEKQLKDTKEQKKSYTSYLHQVVDRNHLQSPSHKLMNQNQHPQDFYQFKLEHQKSHFYTKKVDSELNVNKINPENQRKHESEKVIRPVLIEQKPECKKSSDSPIKQLSYKQKKYTVQVRQIPQNLNESFDELMLSIDKDQKPLKKHPLDSPLKLKNKSHSPSGSSKNSKQNDSLQTQEKIRQKKSPKNKKDEELLIVLPIIEGYCSIHIEGDKKEIETKYLINKNVITFQSHRKILVNEISKIKLIHKEEEQLLIKLTCEDSDNKKPQNIIIKVLGLQQPKDYFIKSYQLYSEILLRKLILMKICINELNQKNEHKPPINHSFQSSPTRSTTANLQSLNVISTQKYIEEHSQKSLFAAQLFKKSVIFNSWEKKYFSLSQHSFQSFSTSPSNGHKSKPTSTLHKTSQIWTRFQLIYGYLVIKLWQNKIEKIQIGIPLCDFTNIRGINNWLFGLSKYILWGKN